MGLREKAFDVTVLIILGLVTLIVLLPLWYLIMVSLTPFEVWTRTGGSLLISPTEMTLEGYRQLLSSARLPRAFAVSVFITTVGTALNLIATTLLAYPLSKKTFPLRQPLLLAVIFTMLFSGGTPTATARTIPTAGAPRLIRPASCSTSTRSSARSARWATGASTIISWCTRRPRPSGSRRSSSSTA
jgi:putative aldouronate transport system permease protein